MGNEKSNRLTVENHYVAIYNVINVKIGVHLYKTLTNRVNNK